MKVITIVGGQFGSEAKGHVAAQYAAREVNDRRSVLAVRVAGPNAGHTAYDKKGRAFALRTIPAMAVVDPSVQLVLAPGSEIDIDVLAHEVDMLESAGHQVRERLFIDRQATWLEPHHIQAETDATMHERLGSTGKGIGAARSDRLLRRARLASDIPGIEEFGILLDTYDIYHYAGSDSTAIVEGTQGFGLGLHAGYYPYCTSSNCRSIDFLAMAGIDPMAEYVDDYRVVMVCRTHPIRVAGNSGPMHAETDWDTLAAETGGHVKPERTTVTKKVRRVGRWDEELFARALAANGGRHAVDVALTFADYIDPEIFDSEVISPKVQGWIVEHLTAPHRVTPRLITTGPKTAVWYRGI